ncbi:MAG: restriction endonuclease subunit S [Chitinophagaceae bacterium]
MEATIAEIQIDRYPAYKDSGVEWLGQIPEHWGIKRIKHLFEEINERSDLGNEELLSVSQYTGVTRKIDKLEEGDLLTNASTLEGYKKVSVGDLVSNIMLAWNGSLGFSSFDGITSPAYSIYRVKTEDEKRYFHYLFRTELYKSEFKRNSSGVIESRLRLYTDSFFRIESILPLPEEQIAIANFLDRKTALIDQAIGIKEKQIELLKERRQILIHKAVTRGLDQNVKMKDSGVEWIGEVPEGWEVKKVKFLFTLKGGGTPSKERRDFWDGDIPWVSPKDMKFDFITTTEDFVTMKGLLNSSSNYIQPNTLLMVVRSGILQRTIPVAISSVGLTINQDMKAFTSLGLITTKYFFYFIKGNDTFLINDWVKEGATVESVEAELLKNGLITLPSMQEQEEIVGHIENLSDKIATAISLKEKEIEKLKEYKATLINSAVTGKIKV